MSTFAIFSAYTLTVTFTFSVSSFRFGPGLFFLLSHFWHFQHSHRKPSGACQIVLFSLFPYSVDFHCWRGAVWPQNPEFAWKLLGTFFCFCSGNNVKLFFRRCWRCKYMKEGFEKYSDSVWKDILKISKRILETYSKKTLEYLEYPEYFKEYLAHLKESLEYSEYIRHLEKNVAEYTWVNRPHSTLIPSHQSFLHFSGPSLPALLCFTLSWSISRLVHVLSNLINRMNEKGFRLDKKVIQGMLFLFSLCKFLAQTLLLYFGSID